jgi:hypothetical protein
VTPWETIRILVSREDGDAMGDDRDSAFEGVGDAESRIPPGFREESCLRSALSPPRYESLPKSGKDDNLGDPQGAEV